MDRPDVPVEAVCVAAVQRMLEGAGEHRDACRRAVILHLAADAAELVEMDVDKAWWRIEAPANKLADIILTHTEFDGGREYSITCQFELCSLLCIEANWGDGRAAAIPSGVAMDILDLYREMGGELVRD